MIVCGDCGQEMAGDERHHHVPDIYMDVWNCEYRLCRSRDMGSSIVTEELPFTIPENWADWVLESCGGAINLSGIYRLPGRIWEWCLAKMRGDEDAAKLIEKGINEYLVTKHKRGEFPPQMP